MARRTPRVASIVAGESRWQAAYQTFVPSVESGHREIYRACRYNPSRTKWSRMTP
jgi:hypothetical protein